MKLLGKAMSWINVMTAFAAAFAALWASTAQATIESDTSAQAGIKIGVGETLV